MSGNRYEVQIRNKKYDVFIKDSATPSTYIEFQYNKCGIIKDVYLKDDISEEEKYLIIRDAAKNAIREYNHRNYLRLKKKGCHENGRRSSNNAI